MARVLIAGCGDVGTALGLLLAGDGHEVFGLRRHTERLSAPIRPVRGDLADTLVLKSVTNDDMFLFGEKGPTPLALKLAVTAYLISLAIFIPVSGWTADRFGARTVFRGAIAVFTPCGQRQVTLTPASP